MAIDRAVILAGGYGRRLAPYTFVIPKPIVPIGTTPILEIVLRQLAFYRFTRITVALGHMSEIIRAVAGDGTKYGVAIDYSDEVTPLGTMGPLRRIRDLPARFLVMNADLLTDLDFRHFVQYHEASGCMATVATYEKTTRLELGVLEVGDDGIISAFREKPTLRHSVSMGIYVFEASVLRDIPEGEAFGFDALMATLLGRREPVKAYRFGGKWLDIGVPADYERAQEEFERNRSAYLPDTREALG